MRRAIAWTGAVTLAAAVFLTSSTPARADEPVMPMYCITEKDTTNQPYYVYFGEDYHKADPEFCPISCSVWVGGQWCTYLREA